MNLSVSFEGETSNLEYIRIELYQDLSFDTILVSNSFCSFPEEDFSGFYTFQKTETGYVFGLGLQNMFTFRCKLYVKRENEAEQVQTLN